MNHPKTKLAALALSLALSLPALAADADVTRRSVAVGWDYPMSRTFHVYADAGFVDQKLENDSVVTSRLRGTEFLMGCVKYF